MKGDNIYFDVNSNINSTNSPKGPSIGGNTVSKQRQVRFSTEDMKLTQLIEVQKRKMSTKITSLFHKKKKSSASTTPRMNLSDSSVPSSMSSSSFTSSSSTSTSSPSTSSSSFSSSSSSSSSFPTETTTATIVSAPSSTPPVDGNIVQTKEEAVSFKRRTEEELSFMDDYLGRCQSFALKWIFLCIFFAVFVGAIEFLSYSRQSSSLSLPSLNRGGYSFIPFESFKGSFNP
eukprot:TRINITY_DN14972_c0_g1_i1.p1 TRINITY_DN14972_c0_g1~~TRINITY_DN14972_c0_g1_i1.p1  ORF type:complete len:231 (+),score=89.93 TRINITY_DN14972_c0_g1_i1:89-781(+)